MSGSTTSTTFNYTGYTVPTTSLCDITASGTQGGNGGEIDAT